MPVGSEHGPLERHRDNIFGPHVAGPPPHGRRLWQVLLTLTDVDQLFAGLDLAICAERAVDQSEGLGRARLALAYVVDATVAPALADTRAPPGYRRDADQRSGVISMDGGAYLDANRSTKDGTHGLVPRCSKVRM